MFPADRKECIRAARIESVQGNENPIVKNACVRAGLWQKQKAGPSAWRQGGVAW